MIDGKLFTPQEWIKDNKHCAKAKIPKNKRTYRTKLQIAPEQVWRAKQNGVYLELVGADSLYGRDYGFAMTLDGWKETFVLDVPENYWIYE